MNAYPLLQSHPALASALPAAGLLRGPTPVLALGEGLWVKRDDLSAADYGGNKVRKLDFLLAAARARGVRELLTFGYAGSNFVAATAWHGRRLGLGTIAYLLPQVHAPYVADNLSVSLHAGAQLYGVPTPARIGAAALVRSAVSLLRHARVPQWIPPGGSSPLGVAGFVNAALELCAQVQAGVLPEPERIYVAFSSMGTVAGLALGLERCGLRSRVVAVQVVDERFASAPKLEALLRRSAALLGRHDARFAALAGPALTRVQIRREFFGDEYGRPTPAASAAMQRFERASGARADSAYSGKALACLYHDLDSDLDGDRAARPVLFWHTFNAHGLPQGVQRAQASQLPAALRGYFSPPAGPG